MPSLKDYLAGRTAVTIVDADELYVRDADADDSKRITWASLKTALASVFTNDDTVDAHIADTVDAHDASAISVADVGTLYTATDVEAALAEVKTIADTAVTPGEAAAAYQPLDADLTTVAAANNGTVLAATTASFTTADESKLDGIETAADVTDTANVTAAGAVMLSTAPVTVSGTTDTLADADNGKVNIYTEATLVTVTLPTDASDDLADGFECLLVAAGAAGLTLSTTGVTLTGSSPNTTIAQNEGLFVKKTATANTWLIVGGTS